MPINTAPRAANAVLDVCLHVTSAEKISLILEQGLIPQIGLLSIQVETSPGIFMFPSWSDLIDANWLLDEAWPHASEPALLCVDVRGLRLSLEAGFEVVSRAPIESSRVTVLAPGENDWDVAERGFYQVGGRATGLTSEEVFAWLRSDGFSV